MAHVYFSTFIIMCVFHIYKMENREPAQDAFSWLVSRQKRIYWWLICCGSKSDKIKIIIIRTSTDTVC